MARPKPMTTAPRAGSTRAFRSIGRSSGRVEMGEQRASAGGPSLAGGPHRPIHWRTRPMLSSARPTQPVRSPCHSWRNVLASPLDPVSDAPSSAARRVPRRPRGHGLRGRSPPKRRPEQRSWRRRSSPRRRSPARLAGRVSVSAVRRRRPHRGSITRPSRWRRAPQRNMPTSGATSAASRSSAVRCSSSSRFSTSW